MIEDAEARAVPSASPKPGPSPSSSQTRIPSSSFSSSSSSSSNASDAYRDGRAGRPSGILAAAPTPFRADGEVDLEAIPALLDHLRTSGCAGALILGTTGEGPSLSLEERKRVIDATCAWRRRAGGPFHLLAGTGCAAPPETLLLSQHACRAGMDGILVLPPFYYKQPGSGGVEAFYLRLADALPDELRLYLYHIPQLSGVALSPDLVARLRERLGERLAGLKDSGGDWAATRAMMESAPELDLFTGSDQHLRAAFVEGASGCITALSNLSAGLSASLVRALAAGDAARAEAMQERISRARGLVEGPNSVANIKAMLGRLTDLPPWPPRPPLEPLPAAEADTMAARLAPLLFGP